LAQYRVRRGSVEGCRVAQMRVWCGSVDSVQHGSVRVRCDSVQGAAWLSSGCGVTQFRLQCGSFHHVVWLSQGVAWISTGWGLAQLKDETWLSWRMRRGSVEDGAWLSKGAVWLSSGNPENERMSVSDPWEKIEWWADSEPRINERVPSSDNFCNFHNSVYWRLHAKLWYHSYIAVLVNPLVPTALIPVQFSWNLQHMLILVVGEHSHRKFWKILKNKKVFSPSRTVHNVLSGHSIMSQNVNFMPDR
jgi:hypothetical protein